MNPLDEIKNSVKEQRDAGQEDIDERARLKKYFGLKVGTSTFDDFLALLDDWERDLRKKQTP